MEASARRSLHAPVLWAAAWVVATVLQLGFGLRNHLVFEAPALLFGIVVVAAAGCTLFSVAILVRAARAGSAETAMLGAFLYGVSVLPLAHGLLIPGVLYGPNDAVVATSQLAVPLAGLAVVPLLAPGLSAASLLARRWRAAIPVHLAVVTTVALVALVRPGALPSAATGTGGAVAAALASWTVCFVISRRHLRLATISGSNAALTLAGAMALVGAAPLLFVAGDFYGVAFWLAHALDITGVLLAAVVALCAYDRGATTARLLAPLEAATPLRALEVGLDPLVHRFVADLESKDEITRDHVVRTARLAVAVAEELRLPAETVRAVGVGAILHDVGKLEIPDAILQKPGRLTAEEFEVMKAHTRRGEAMVRQSEAVRDAAPFVRGHHERVDGRGYPDGLVGGAIPLGARIVAACDAYDAMSNTRQYREGMDHDKVVAIMREHRGAQWDATVVDALLRVVGRDGPPPATELGDVGRDHELLLCCGG